MSPNSFCPDERACATFLSTRVGSSPFAQLHPLTDAFVATDTKVVYRRYASLFFIAGCSSTDNELITLEIVHRYVEQMDKYYGNVCELDIIFNFQKAYFILDELLLAGEMQESSKKNVLRCISQQDSLEDMEVGQKKILTVARTYSSNPFVAFFPLSLSCFSFLYQFPPWILDTLAPQRRVLD